MDQAFDSGRGILEQLITLGRLQLVKSISLVDFLEAEGSLHLAHSLSLINLRHVLVANRCDCLLVRQFNSIQVLHLYGFKIRRRCK